MSILALCTLIYGSLVLTTSYNIDWSNAFTYYNGGTRNPYLIYLRSQTSDILERLLVCFEETSDLDFSGICETLELDVTNEVISFGSKNIFEAANASNAYEIQIYNQGPTNYFILGYTNGPNPSTGPGKVLMGQYNLNTGDIVYGNVAHEFNPYSNDQTHLIELQSNSYFIVCSSAGPNNQYDTACRIGQYQTADLSIAFGVYKAFNMTTGHHTQGMATSRIDADTFVACFSAYVNRIGVCYVGTVVDDFANGLDSDIEFGNEIVFNDDGLTDTVKIIHANSTTLIVCFETHDAFGEGGRGECMFAVVETLSSGRKTLVFQSNRFDYEDDHAIDSASIFRVNAGALDGQNPELLGVCYVDTDAGVCKFGEVDLNNLSIKFDDSATNAFDSRGIGTLTTAYLGSGANTDGVNKLVVCYVDYSGSTPLFNRGHCKYGTITNNYNTYNYTK